MESIIVESIRRLCQAEVELADRNADAAEAKRLKHEAEQQVIDALVNEEIDRITVDGRSYSYSIKPRLAPAKGMADKVVMWVKENGGADLVKPTMNARSRDAFLCEVLVDDDGEVRLPPELNGLIAVYEQPVLHTKTT